MYNHINEEMLFKYFRGETTEDENTNIDKWLQASDSNRKRFRNTFSIFEALALTAAENSYANSGRGQKRSTIRTIIIAAANIAAVVAIFFGAIKISEKTVSNKLSGTLTSIEVPAGQQLDITLSDGTTVKLNSGARLSYPVVFSKKQRTVNLTGEAYFSVTHDKNLPFVVKTFASDIKVLGTKFNVIAEESSKDFSVSLIEGSVRVGNSEESLLLKPNETASLIGGHLAKTTGQSARDILWTKGIIEIGGISFSDLMAKFEKSFGVRIIIDRPAAPALNCTGGEIRINDGIDYALKVLQHLSDFSYERSADGDTIRIK